jgi:ZIP family zinc transporter
VDLSKTLVLGLIAGGTIFIGLPIGRLKRPMPALRVFLNAIAIGILLFLIWDVLSNAWEPIDSALSAIHDHTGGVAPAIRYGALFFIGLSVGLLSLVYWEKFMHRRTAPPPPPKFGPGAMAVAEAEYHAAPSKWTVTRRLSLMIAIGIGSHNFGEGLAIGQSAARSEVALATLLVVGFALHNATEGFGIVAPLAGDRDAEGNLARPTWAFLFTLGAIGGFPTFFGTWVGHSFTSDALSIFVLTLAAGSILYVVLQLVNVAAKARRPDLVAYGILLGLFAGFLTDAIVSAGGA